MTKEVANALRGYFEELYYLNRNLLTLCGLDIEDNAGQYERIAQELIQEVPRLVPYTYNKKTKGYEIIDGDGLIEFSEQIPFIKQDYNNLLQNHLDYLTKIKIIRNKLEHKMHAVRLIGGGSSGGSVAFDFTYSINDESIDIASYEIIRFIKDLNNIFVKIQDLLKQYATEHGKGYYAYYRRMTRYKFSDFNKIYDSNVLFEVGKALYPF